MTQTKKTNREFSQDTQFQAACERAGVPATKRQASKFRMRRGRAYTGRGRFNEG